MIKNKYMIKSKQKRRKTKIKIHVTMYYKKKIAVKKIV